MKITINFVSITLLPDGRSMISLNTDDDVTYFVKTNNQGLIALLNSSDTALRRKGELEAVDFVLKENNVEFSEFEIDTYKEVRLTTDAAFATMIATSGIAKRLGIPTSRVSEYRKIPPGISKQEELLLKAGYMKEPENWIAP